MHTEIAVNICLRLSGLNLFGRKDFGWFSEVFAATRVESKPIKEVSMIPLPESKDT